MKSRTLILFVIAASGLALVCHEFMSGGPKTDARVSTDGTIATPRAAGFPSTSVPDNARLGIVTESSMEFQPPPTVVSHVKEELETAELSEEQVAFVERLRETYEGPCRDGESCDFPTASRLNLAISFEGSSVSQESERILDAALKTAWRDHALQALDDSLGKRGRARKAARVDPESPEVVLQAVATATYKMLLDRDTEALNVEVDDATLDAFIAQQYDMLSEAGIRPNGRTPEEYVRDPQTRENYRHLLATWDTQAAISDPDDPDRREKSEDWMRDAMARYGVKYAGLTDDQVEALPSYLP